MKTSILSLLMFALCAPTMAQNPQPNPAPINPFAGIYGEAKSVYPNIRIRRGDFQSIQITPSNLFGYVEKAVITFRSSGLGSGQIEVFANGRSKGTYNARAIFRRSEVVTVNEYTSTLEFRHVSGNAVKLKKIVALPISPSCSTFNQNHCNNNPLNGGIPAPVMAPDPLACGPIPSGAMGSIAALQGLLNLTRVLNFVVDVNDVQTYLLPVKIKAERALAVASTGATLSNEFREKIQDLITQLDQEEAFEDKLNRVTATENYGQMWVRYHEILKRSVQ